LTNQVSLSVMPHFPEPVQTLYETALQHEQEKNWGAAAACYEQAVTLVTDSAELWARYGRLLNQEGVRNSDGHIELSAGTRAANCPATTADELYWRGIGAMLSDGTGNSQRDLAASLALNPTRADTWYQYAEALAFPAAYFAYSNYDASPKGQAHRLHAYDQALALDPDNPRYLADRGGFHLAHDRLVEALNDLDAAMALDPALRQATENRAIIRFLRHDFRGALQDLAAGEPLRGSWRAMGAESHIRYPAPGLLPPAERWASALTAFEQSGLREPTTVQYLSERAVYYLAHGHPEQALADAQAVVARQTLHAPYRELLVQCLLAQKKLDFDALLGEYEWLAARPLPRVPAKRDVLVEKVLHQAQCRWNQTRWRHHAAWAAYRLGQPEAAQTHFGEACGFFFTEQPYQVKRDAFFQLYPSDDLQEQNIRVPYRRVEATIVGREYRLGDVVDLLPLRPEPEYLRWQFTQQLRQEPASLGVLLAASEWLNQVAWQLAGPALGEACEACLKLLPAGYHFVRSRQAAEYEAARVLCQDGLAQCPAYAAEFRLLRRALLRAELREAQNQRGATPAAIQAALDTYDAGLTALRAEEA
jgi:Tfp pilus assembly protein PilF